MRVRSNRYAIAQRTEQLSAMALQLRLSGNYRELDAAGVVDMADAMLRAAEERSRQVIEHAGDNYRIKRTLSADGLAVEVERDGTARFYARPDGAESGPARLVATISSEWRRRLHELLSDEGLDRLDE